jgi:hypothetical protein
MLAEDFNTTHLPDDVEFLAGEAAQRLLQSAPDVGKTAMGSDMVERRIIVEGEVRDALSDTISRMDAFESSGDLPSKAGFIAALTENIQTISRTGTAFGLPDIGKIFRYDPHFQSLDTGSIYSAKLLLDRAQHEKILTYLERHGNPTDATERAAIQAYFKERDMQKRRETMHSYAAHGLLTFGDAFRAGIMNTASATPGDIYDGGNFLDIGDDGGVIGYDVPGSASFDPFTESGGFYTVTIERSWESMTVTGRLPQVELENRISNSMLFVAKQATVEDRVRNERQEDILVNSLAPDQIDYVVVSEENYETAVESFANTPIRVLKAYPADIELYEGEPPFRIPDYEGAVREIVEKDGPVWCHITRLKEDTYPPGFDSVEAPLSEFQRLHQNS